MALASRALLSGMETRSRWEGGGPPVADVQLSELKRDPMGVVARLYRQFGIELTGEVDAAMRRWLARKHVRHGGHKFALGDFGLSAGAMAAEPVFRRYCEEYAIQGCAA